MEDLDTLLKPFWGSEKWILEGWNKITDDERKDIKNRVENLFKNGLPFEIKYDKLLYLYIFSLMAQLEVLGIQLPMRFEDKMHNPELKKRMRAQLVDEIYHAIVFTKIIFTLCAPYATPPAYNQEIERICEFIRAQDCLKVGMVVMNLVCEGLVEEVFTIFHKYGVATELFELIIEDEHRHVCEADLYREIGLPDKEILAEKLRALEELLISAFSLQPKYDVALSVLIGPRGTGEFLMALQEKHIRQLKKIDMVPSEKWELVFQLAPEAIAELEPHKEELTREAELEIFEVEMTPLKKIFMYQLDNPGDPTTVAQFSIDISNFGYFDNKYPPELLTPLMMQAVSHMGATEDSFRNFLSYKKMYRTRGAYVALYQKLPGCGDHLATIFFRDCHELSPIEMLPRIKRTIEMMVYCYKKREQVEKEHPELKRRLDDLLYEYAHDVYPCPIPVSYGAYIANAQECGYEQVVAPLLKQTNLQLTLLAVERKPVWNNTTRSFEPKDVLPVSLSADGRIFDGTLPVPKLLNESFQLMFEKMNERMKSSLKDSDIAENNYKEKADKIAETLLTKEKIKRGEKIAQYLASKKIVLKEARRIFGDDIEDFELYGEKLSQYSDFKNIANNLLLDYLGFNAEEAAKNEKLTRMIDKMLAENVEMGYRILSTLQTLWLDYVDIEAVFNTAYKKVAQTRLIKLAKFIPTIGKRLKYEDPEE